VGDVGPDRSSGFGEGGGERSGGVDLGRGRHLNRFVVEEGRSSRVLGLACLEGFAFVYTISSFDYGTYQTGPPGIQFYVAAEGSCAAWRDSRGSISKMRA
jgi:hypothetical protein